MENSNIYKQLFASTSYDEYCLLCKIYNLKIPLDVKNESDFNCFYIDDWKWNLLINGTIYQVEHIFNNDTAKHEPIRSINILDIKLPLTFII